MKNEHKLSGDRLLEFVTGQVLRENLSTLVPEHVTTDTVCYLTEWKHVLVYGRRVSTATYRIRHLPVMDFEEHFQSHDRGIPESAKRCAAFTVEQVRDLPSSEVTKICHSTFPAIAGSGDLDMIRAAERYKQTGIYNKSKQASL